MAASDGISENCISLLLIYYIPNQFIGFFNSNFENKLKYFFDSPIAKQSFLGVVYIILVSQLKLFLKTNLLFKHNLNAAGYSKVTAISNNILTPITLIYSICIFGFYFCSFIYITVIAVSNTSMKAYACFFSYFTH